MPAKSKEVNSAESVGDQGVLSITESAGKEIRSSSSIDLPDKNQKNMETRLDDTEEIYPATFEAAMLLAQQEIKAIQRDNTAAASTTRSYQYATITVIREVITPIINKYGLFLTSKAHWKDIGGQWTYVLTTTLEHINGVKEQSDWPIRGDTPQQMGSWRTYGRRYNIIDLLNLASEDDDAASIEESRPARTGSRNRSGQAIRPDQRSQSEPRTETGSKSTSDQNDRPDQDPKSDHQVTIEEWDKRLEKAAATGNINQLREVWSGMPPDAQKSLKAALERRHKPTCETIGRAGT